MRKTILKVEPIGWSKEEDCNILTNFSKLTKEQKEQNWQNLENINYYNRPIREWEKLFWDENIKEEMKELFKIQPEQVVGEQWLGHCHPVCSKMVLNYLGVDINEMPNNRDFQKYIERNDLNNLINPNPSKPNEFNDWWGTPKYWNDLRDNKFLKVEKATFYNNMINSGKTPNYSLTSVHSEEILYNPYRLNIFQEHIERSLKNNVPIVFSTTAYKSPSGTLGQDFSFDDYMNNSATPNGLFHEEVSHIWGPHSFVINGINIDEKDPLKTKYLILDPNIGNVFNSKTKKNENQSSEESNKKNKKAIVECSAVIDGETMMNMSVYPYQIMWDKSNSNFIQEVNSVKEDSKYTHELFSSETFENSVGKREGDLIKKRRYKKGVSKDIVSKVCLKVKYTDRNNDIEKKFEAIREDWKIKRELPKNNNSNFKFKSNEGQTREQLSERIKNLKR